MYQDHQAELAAQNAKLSGRVLGTCHGALPILAAAANKEQSRSRADGPLDYDIERIHACHNE
jgi:hypothetical protein